MDQSVSRVHQLLVKIGLYFYTMGTHFGKPLITEVYLHVLGQSSTGPVNDWPDLKVLKRVI